MLFLFVLGITSSPVQAGCPGCIEKSFEDHREWFTNDFFKKKILPELQEFTQDISAMAMKQAMIIGTFFDAKQQLETQRLFQELQNEAHRDYQPSEDFCWFGTNVRSLAHSEEKARFNIVALSARQLARHLGTEGSVGAKDRDHDKRARWRQYTGHYCDPGDSGTQGVCKVAPAAERRNLDIDFTRLIEEPRTLDVAFSDDESSAAEQDVMALGNNLYGHHVLSRNFTAGALGKTSTRNIYMALRAVAAKRNVAEHSFNTIVGLKSSGSAGEGQEGTWQFLLAVMAELGIPDDEIPALIGESPSYYAQLEILAKKIYQNPGFYANLYDKPANVERKSVALKAIELMLDRAIYESQLRQEMAMSVLLSTRLEKEQRGGLK